MEKYTIMLTREEVDRLNAITSKGTVKAKIAHQARALLLLDKGEFTDGDMTIKETAKATGLSVRSINNLKKGLVEKGLEAIINPPPYGKSKRPIKFDGDIQAKVTQLACEKAPDGRNRWTLRLLADKMVELKYVDSISEMTVHRLLKKRN
ncbi:MAG: helix-turn-helix domain-containing protein [Burkholderiales bacterium]|nr:helix-turn-helix domain-containing protein [Burkholderiales bacterium]